MARVDDVIESLLVDAGLRLAVANDPEQALAAYGLSDGERALLIAWLFTGTPDAPPPERPPDSPLSSRERR